MYWTLPPLTKLLLEDEKWIKPEDVSALCGILGSEFIFRVSADVAKKAKTITMENICKINFIL